MPVNPFSIAFGDLAGGPDSSFNDFSNKISDVFGSFSVGSGRASSSRRENDTASMLPLYAALGGMALLILATRKR